MKSKVRIYVLRDASGIRYVGKTTQCLSDRLQTHKYKALKHRKTPKQIWLAGLLESGQEPIVELLEIVNIKDSGEAERQWMAKLSAAGCNLVNDAPAGAGNQFHRIVDWSCYAHLLGRIPDEELGELVGVSRKAVSYQRNKRDIKPCGNREEKRVPPPMMAGHNAIELSDDIIDRLGTEPDHVLAEKAGVSKKRIMNARHKRDIPSWAEKNGHPTRFDGKGLHPRWLVPLKGGGSIAP